MGEWKRREKNGPTWKVPHTGRTQGLQCHSQSQRTYLAGGIRENPLPKPEGLSQLRGLSHSQTQGRKRLWGEEG